MSEMNPFLVDIPWVTIVTQVRLVNGEEVESEQSDSTRIWGRVFSPTGTEEIIEDVPKRVFPQTNGLTRQQPF